VEVRSLWNEPEPSELSFGALEFHDVFKIYRSRVSETVALRGLELRIEPSEFVALFGPSGSGKSTALHLAAALDEPSSGDVRVAGQSLGRLDERRLAHYRARDIGIVFQSGNLWPQLPTRENIVLALRLAGRRDADEAADAALNTFGLRTRGQQLAGSLSGGEQQRVAVASAAARGADLVLADEPTAELDERNERNVLDALLQLREHGGSTVVVVTHSLRVAAIADRVLELRDGRIV